MDTKLLKATLYSGSQIPGGGPYSHTAPVQPQAADSLVAAFNAGFLMSGANGGYYTDGKTILPLRAGAASFVIYRNGTATVGHWGPDVSMTPNVVSVRQNLNLLVDGGQPVPGLNATDTTQWGNTLGNAVYVWRSGIGVTSDGALVYVGGPGLNITDLANLLVRAGAVRAMELDINTDWVNFSVYKPATPRGRHRGQRHRTPPRHDGNTGPLLSDVVGSGLLHHVRRSRNLTCASDERARRTIPTRPLMPHSACSARRRPVRRERWLLGSGPCRSEKHASSPVDQKCPGLRGSGSSRSSRSPDRPPACTGGLRDFLCCRFGHVSRERRRRCENRPKTSRQAQSTDRPWRHQSAPSQS